MTDILITGGTGQLGMELQRLAWPDGVKAYFPSRAELDLFNTDDIEHVVASRAWAAVINAAAYTAVDKAESDIAAAWSLNALAPAVVAAETARAGIPLVHLSTDYVFDGTKAEPYVEDDPVAPVSVYGASKACGEQGVRTGNPRHVIARTSWVVSEHRTNFLKTMLRLSAERPRFGVVADQHGSPTSARDLAEALAAITMRLARDQSAPLGMFHLTNAGSTSWHRFATEIMNVAYAGRKDAPIIDAIKTEQYPTPAKRPANSRLATARIKSAYGIALRPWQDATAEIVRTLVTRQTAERKVSK